MGTIIRLLLVDDHTIVRAGLKAIIEMDGRYKVIGEAENGNHAIHLSKQLQPDLVVMDIGMPFLNGLEAARQILRFSPQMKILFLCDHMELTEIDLAVRL